MNEVVEVIELLTTEDLVRRFGRSKITVNNYRKVRGLPYVRLPGRARDSIRYRTGRVVKWARKHGKKFDTRGLSTTS